MPNKRRRKHKLKRKHAYQQADTLSAMLHSGRWQLFVDGQFVPATNTRQHTDDGAVPATLAPHFARLREPADWGLNLDEGTLVGRPTREPELELLPGQIVLGFLQEKLLCPRPAMIWNGAMRRVWMKPIFQPREGLRHVGLCVRLTDSLDGADGPDRIAVQLTATTLPIRLHAGMVVGHLVPTAVQEESDP